MSTARFVGCTTRLVRVFVFAAVFVGVFVVALVESAFFTVTFVESAFLVITFVESAVFAVIFAGFVESVVLVVSLGGGCLEATCVVFVGGLGLGVLAAFVVFVCVGGVRGGGVGVVFAATGLFFRVGGAVSFLGGFGRFLTRARRTVRFLGGAEVFGRLAGLTRRFGRALRRLMGGGKLILTVRFCLRL